MRQKGLNTLNHGNENFVPESLARVFSCPIKLIITFSIRATVVTSKTKPINYKANGIGFIYQKLV